MQVCSLRVRRIDAQTNRPSRGTYGKQINGDEQAAATAVQGKTYFLPMDVIWGRPGRVQEGEGRAGVIGGRA